MDAIFQSDFVNFWMKKMAMLPCVAIEYGLLELVAKYANIYIRSTPHPVTVTTRIITFLVGNPYKPSFATVTGWGVDLIYTVFNASFF